MKHLTVLLLLFSIALLVMAQNPHPGSPIEEMVATERAFAKMSEEKGTTPSFLAFIADDGILFRPKAVKGKQWLLENPPPASDKRPWLKWEPTFAHMAGAGDMGYTFGPWEYRRDIKDAEAVAFGHFLTVWKKQPDGTWKFAVDLGISHPKPDSPVIPLHFAVGNRTPHGSRRINIAAERAALTTQERATLTAGKHYDAQAAFFISNSVRDVRVFREGKFPFVGRSEAMTVLDSRANAWTWKVEFIDVSRSGDLAYSYGTYKLAAMGAKPAETGNYLRVWKKEGHLWKIAVDLANPILDGKN
jgi:ketosteroid isomerase-like protein